MTENTPALTPAAVKALLEARGWSVSNLAFRWDVSLGYLSSVIHDARRAAHFNDAFVGLPQLTRAQSREWTRRRQALAAHRPPRLRKSSVSIVHERGDVFVSSAAVDHGEGYRYVLTAPDRVPEDYEGIVVLEALDDGERFEVPYRELLDLFTETGAKI